MPNVIVQMCADLINVVPVCKPNVQRLLSCLVALCCLLGDDFYLTATGGNMPNDDDSLRIIIIASASGGATLLLIIIMLVGICLCCYCFMCKGNAQDKSSSIEKGTLECDTESKNEKSVANGKDTVVSKKVSEKPSRNKVSSEQCEVITTGPKSVKDMSKQLKADSPNASKVGTQASKPTLKSTTKPKNTNTEVKSIEYDAESKNEKSFTNRKDRAVCKKVSEKPSRNQVPSKQCEVITTGPTSVKDLSKQLKADSPKASTVGTQASKPTLKSTTKPKSTNTEMKPIECVAESKNEKSFANGQDTAVCKKVSEKSSMSTRDKISSKRCEIITGPQSGKGKLDSPKASKVGTPPSSRMPTTLKSTTVSEKTEVKPEKKDDKIFKNGWSDDGKIQLRTNNSVGYSAHSRPIPSRAAPAPPPARSLNPPALRKAVVRETASMPPPRYSNNSYTQQALAKQ